MAYQSLYRRYRPQRFDEVWGQQHLVQALRNAVRDERVGHAYLFSGPRGTGKTTSARLLAKALNCPNVADGEPCGACESCRAIAEGSSFDVFELDAASNNGVDAIRDLTERANQGSPGRRKVYILDEVHMLSGAASNALLKTLEEPPEHVVFVLATTDPQKVLPTIKSRTQHFEVHLLSADELEAGIAGVIEDAGLDVPEGAVEHVLRAGGGSARDTLSALERVVAFGGIPADDDVLDVLVDALCDRDAGAALAAIERGIASGRAPRTLGEDLMARLRDVFLASVGAELGRLSDRDRTRVREQAERLGPRGSTHALEVLGLAFQGISEAPDPRIPLEVAVLRLTRSELDTSPAALLERIERLERQLAGGVVAAAPTASPAPAPAARGAGPATEPGEAGGEPTIVDTPAPPAAEVPASEGAQPEGTGQGDAPKTTGGAADEARRMLAARRGANGGRKAAGPARRSRQAPVAGEATAATGPAASPGPIDPSALAPSEAAARRSSRTPAPADRSGDVAGEAPTAPPGPDEAASPTGPGRRPAHPTAAADAGPGRGGDDGVEPTGGVDTDALVGAWADSILGSLPQKAKARYGGGRIVAVEGDTVVFGLPNEVHRKRCEEVQGIVEEGIGAHLGQAVSLRLVVDTDAPTQRRPGDARPATAAADAPAAEEDVDVTELVDATDLPTSEVDRIAEVFPGAELIDEEPTP